MRLCFFVESRIYWDFSVVFKDNCKDRREAEKSRAGLIENGLENPFSISTRRILFNLFIIIFHNFLQIELAKIYLLQVKMILAFAFSFLFSETF